MKSMRPVKTAILGLGRIGWNRHARVLSARKDYHVVAAADPLPERRREAAAELGCATYAGLAAMLKQTDAELVVVATRSVDHARHTTLCLEAGKHVLLEKPAAMNCREMDALIRLARRKKRVLTVHQNNRFSDRTLYVKKLIDSGIIGDIFEIKFTGHNFQLRNDWQTLRKNGGGHLFNHGAHWVDAAIFLLPSPVREVWGDMKHLVAGGDAEDYFKVILRSANGCLADIEMSLAATYPHESLVVMGTRGTLTAGRNLVLRWFRTGRKTARGRVIDGAAPGRVYGHVMEEIKWREKTIVKIPDQKADFYGNLVAAIRRRKKLIITPESVREQIRVLDEVRRSARRPRR